MQKKQQKLSIRLWSITKTTKKWAPEGTSGRYLWPLTIILFYRRYLRGVPPSSAVKNRTISIVTNGWLRWQSSHFVMDTEPTQRQGKSEAQQGNRENCPTQHAQGPPAWFVVCIIVKSLLDPMAVLLAVAAVVNNPGDLVMMKMTTVMMLLRTVQILARIPGELFHTLMGALLVGMISGAAAVAWSMAK